MTTRQIPHVISLLMAYGSLSRQDAEASVREQIDKGRLILNDDFTVTTRVVQVRAPFP